MSEHFSWEELTKTDHAELQDENMSEAEKYRPALEALAELLELIREKTGPLFIRAFRCGKVNSSSSGSSSKSQHLKGEAADIRIPGQCGQAQVRNLFATCCKLLVDGGIPFGQLIFEQKEHEDGSWVYWVHVSIGQPWRDVVKCGMVMEMEWPWKEPDPKYTPVKRTDPGGL